MNTCMRNGDERKGEVQRDTSTYRWCELDDYGKQEPENTLEKKNTPVDQECVGWKKVPFTYLVPQETA